MLGGCEEFARDFRKAGAIEAGAEDGLAFEIDVLITVVAVEVPAIFKQVVAGIGDGSLIAAHIVGAGLAYEDAYRDDPIWIGVVERAVGGEELAPLRTVMLVVGQQGEVGAVARMEGEGCAMRRRSSGVKLV